MTDKLDAIPGSTGRKIIDGLKDAVAGNFASVTIEGQRWVRADAPQAPTWDERLFDRLAQLQASGVKKMTINQVVGLIGFVRDGEGGAPPAPSAASSDTIPTEMALNWMRLGARAMRRHAEAACGNHSEGAQEDAMTSGGLTREDKLKLAGEADAADAIRDVIASSCEDSAFGYASYMGSDADQEALKALGINSNWLYRLEAGVPSRAERPADPRNQGEGGGPR